MIMKNVANSISVLAKTTNPLQMLKIKGTVYSLKGSIATKKIHRGHRRTLLRKKEGNGPVLRREVRELTKQINSEEKQMRELEKKLEVAKKRINFLLRKRIISMAKNLSHTSKK